MTRLRGQVAGYLALRRAMGFKMEKYGPLLDSLAGYLEEAGLGTVTTQAAVEWAMLPQGVHPHRWKQRLDAAPRVAPPPAPAPPRTPSPPAPGPGAPPPPPPPLIFSRPQSTPPLSP